MQSFFNNIYKWILQCMSKWENGKIITEANPVAEGKGKAQKFVREVNNDELIQVRWTSQTSLLFNHVRQKKRKEKRDKHIIKASLFQNIWDCNLPLFSRTNRRLFMLALCKTWLKRQRWSLARFIFLLSFSDNVCGRHQMCSSLQANFGLKCRSILTFTESLPKLLLVDIVFEHDTIYRCRKASIFLTAIRGLNSLWLMLKESLIYYITDRVLMHYCQTSRKCIKTMLFHHILRNHIFFCIWYTYWYSFVLFSITSTRCKFYCRSEHLLLSVTFQNSLSVI